MENTGGTHKNGVILRIYTGESSFFEGKPVHEKIMREAKRLGLATVTVYRGAMGFDQYHHMYEETDLHVGDVLPLTIEIVDTVEAVSRIYPYLKEMKNIGIATIVSTEIVKF